MTTEGKKDDAPDLTDFLKDLKNVLGSAKGEGTDKALALLNEKFVEQNVDLRAKNRILNEQIAALTKRAEDAEKVAAGLKPILDLGKSAEDLKKIVEGAVALEAENLRLKGGQQARDAAEVLGWDGAALAYLAEKEGLEIEIAEEAEDEEDEESEAKKVVRLRRRGAKKADGKADADFEDAEKFVEKNLKIFRPSLERKAKDSESESTAAAEEDRSPGRRIIRQRTGDLAPDKATGTERLVAAKRASGLGRM